MQYAFAVCTALLLLAQLAAAQAPTTPDPNQPETIELALSAAAEPRPALKYTLLPTPAERSPGNAAQHYYKAILLQKNQPKEIAEQFHNNYQRWLAAKRDDFPREEVAKWLATQSSVLAEVKIGALRESCDWDFRLQDLRGPELLGFLLPEIQECRTLGRTLQLKAHWEIMTGRHDEALQTLRLGYQLARDTSQPPYLICALVGVAIESIMDQELLVLMQHSQANYYWALASLPKPLIELRRAMEFEMNMPQQLFPLLKDAETVHRSPDEWRRELIGCIRGLQSIDGSTQMEPWQSELAAAGLVAKLFPLAKEQLLADGFDRQKLEAMPVAQVVAIHTSRSVEYAFQEVFKLSFMPYHEALAREPALLKRLEEQGYLHGKLGGREGLPITSLLMPAVAAVRHAEMRSARNPTALQVIEAIRMHAAATGKLPASLAEITIVPVPINPATGQPFEYQLDAAAATGTLEFPATGNMPARHDARRYVMRLKGK
jgi:hypothetical protein